MDPGERRFLGLPGPGHGRYDLPDFDEVHGAMLDEELREFLQGADHQPPPPRRTPRRPATQAEIAAAGVQAGVEDILQSIRGEESHAVKRTRAEGDFANAYKVYANVENDSGHEEDRRRKVASHNNMDAISQKIENFWFETSSNIQTFGLGGGVHLSSEAFHEAARPMVEIVTNAVQQWQVKEYLDLFGSDPVTPVPTEFKLFDSLCTCPELIIEVCKHLRPKDIINLYSVSRDFHKIVDDHMQSTVTTWARFMAPSSVGIFPISFYEGLFIKDPAGRPVDPAYYDMKHLSVPGQAPREVTNNEVRLVPGLKWLDMVVTRHIRVRDIIATLARMGHRFPPKMHILLKKIWLMMDISTNMGRANMMRNEEIFTHVDIYLLHFFCVKLVLAFSDPIYGPESPNLLKLMLGQRGLSPLWAMLRRKKYTTRFELRALKVAYDIEPTAYDIAHGRPIYGVPVLRMGRVHTEGWGLGDEHLMRPDEFLGLESAKRQLNFSLGLNTMFIYGHFDFYDGSPATPTLEEMYMSDDEEEEGYGELLDGYREAGIVTHRVWRECGNVPFENWMWSPRDLKKKGWENLSVEERSAIEMEEKEEFSQTFNPQKWCYNFMVRVRALKCLLKFISGSSDDALQLPIHPTGKVKGVFDPVTFARWGSTGMFRAILAQLPADGTLLEPPADWVMDWDVLHGLHNSREYRHFLLPGEEDPLMDDEELLGLGGNPDVDPWDEREDEELWPELGGRNHWGDEDDEDDEEGDEEDGEEYGEEGEEYYGEEGEEYYDEEDGEEDGEEEYDEEMDEGTNREEDRDGDVEMVDADDGLEEGEVDEQPVPEVGSPNFRAINLPFRPHAL